MKINDYNFAGKKAIVRVDFNVPLKDGKITDDTRIRGALPTLKLILEKGGALIIMSHMGKLRSRTQLLLLSVLLRLSSLLTAQRLRMQLHL